MLFRGGCTCSAEISAGWTRNLYLLPGRLSKARSPKGGEAEISSLARPRCGHRPYSSFWHAAAMPVSVRVVSGSPNAETAPSHVVPPGRRKFRQQADPSHTLVCGRQTEENPTRVNAR